MGRFQPSDEASYALMSPTEKRALAGTLLALRMGHTGATRARDSALRAARTADEYHLTECHQRLMVAIAVLDDAAASFHAAIFANTPPGTAEAERRMYESAKRRNKEARGG